MKPGIVLAVCAALLGCSSGDSTAPPPEEQTGELIQYDAIAGSWSGWDYGATYSFQVSVGSEAYEGGEEVGTFEATRIRDGRPVSSCSLPLGALPTSPPTYVFDTSGGSCTPTKVTFTHDPVADRIEVTNSSGESGYLIPGTDPGPPPE